jgi:uncharacterized membrane protein
MSLVLLVLLLGQLLNKKSVLKKAYLTVWLCLIILLVILNNVLIARLYPIIINLALLTVFALSLKNPPTIAERFARLKHGDALPEKAVKYCRRVTQVWCAFFVTNISISAVTLFMSMKVWSLYNGLISYIMMGAIFTIEYIVRMIYMKGDDNGAKPEA